MNLENEPSRPRGRPLQPLAQRLAHKTTAKNPGDFADDECWYPVLKGMRSFGRATTTARAVFEAYLGRRLGPAALERLEHTCRGFRVVDGEVTRCCNPKHQLLIVNGIAVETIEAKPTPEHRAPEPEIVATQEGDLPLPVFHIPEPTREEEIIDLKDAFDAIGPAHRLDHGEMMTRFIDLYDEDIIREALAEYGVSA